MVLESKSETSEKYCRHYPYNTQVGISLNANLLSKMAIEPHSDSFHSYPSFGAGFGVYLYQRVYKWFGIQIGAECNAITSRYSKLEPFSTNTHGKGMTASGSFTFPILFNASYYFNEKHGLDISLGGAPLILFPGEMGTDVRYYNGVDNYSSYRFTLELEPFNFSLYGKIGYTFLFKNKNTLGVAVIGNCAISSYGKGFYAIDMHGGTKLEEGSTSIRNTYIGLQFSFGFTMKKLLCIPN